MENVRYLLQGIAIKCSIKYYTSVPFVELEDYLCVLSSTYQAPSALNPNPPEQNPLFYLQTSGSGISKQTI